MNRILTTESTESTEGILNALSGQVVDSAIYIHRQLGPGLLESAYQRALAYVLGARGVAFEKEKPVPVRIDGQDIGCGFRADFVLGGRVIVELKSVSALQPLDEAQLLTYMRLGGYPLGLLLNFNVRLMKDGIRRMRL